MATAPKTKWITLPPMSVARATAVAVSHQNKLYVFGGSGAHITAPLDDAEVFDQTENKWTLLPKLPRKRSAASIAKVGDKIALIGGFRDQGQPVTEVDVFDTVTQAWELFPPLKTNSTLYPTIVTIEKDIYVFGGSNHKGETTKSCYVLEDSAGDWKELCNFSTERYAAKAYHHDNKIVVIGGRIGRAPVMETDIYDISKGVWNLKAAKDIPKTRIFMVTVQHGSHVYMLNGLNAPLNFHGTTERFDLEKEEWQTMKPAPFQRGDTSVGVMKNYIILVGGMCEYGPNQVTEVFDTNTKEWFTLEEMPTPRISTSAAELDHMFVVVGGVGLRGPVDIVEALVFEE